MEKDVGREPAMIALRDPGTWVAGDGGIPVPEGLVGFGWHSFS
jgi:hypothetical protein